jgi:hypothetical protein
MLLMAKLRQASDDLADYSQDFYAEVSMKTEKMFVGGLE